MSDEFAGDHEVLVPSPDEPLAEMAPEVALVVPAAVYDSIDTDDHRLPPIASTGESATLAAVEALGESLQRRLDGLQTLFDREIRAEATREKVVDRLHAELQEYKQDLLLNVLRPVFIDLIQLHDDIGKIVAAHPDAEGDPRRLLELMAGFQQGIEDVLYRQGVEPFALTGETFDPKRQRAVATVPTDDPSLNKTIAARHRKGFQVLAGEKLIRPEIVSVYALRKPG